ncbi:MAG: hypothetical protein WCV85_00350 [Patescibacteria group bacterium]
MSKYGKYRGNDIEAVFNMLGGEAVVDAMLQGTKQARIEDVILTLFDRHGRGIPRGLQSSVCDESRLFHLQIPGMDFGKLLERLTAVFPEGTVFSTVQELQDEVQEILAIITTDPQLKNCLGRTWFPLTLPKIEAGDYGTILETTFVAAVEKAYLKAFPDRSFINHCKGELGDQVSIVHPSHKCLVAKMQKGPVAGIFLPNSLQGFSIPADREFADQLPEIFHLAGGYDFCTAMAGYPEVLARNFFVPGYDMAGVKWQSEGYSLYLGASDDGLGFGGKFLGACVQDSGGLFIAR